MQKTRTDVDSEIGHLLLEQTLMPKKVVDFAGPSHFGGSQDDLVICAGKGNDKNILCNSNADYCRNQTVQCTSGTARQVSYCTNSTWAGFELGDVRLTN